MCEWSLGKRHHLNLMKYRIQAYIYCSINEDYMQIHHLYDTVRRRAMRWFFYNFKSAYWGRNLKDWCDKCKRALTAPQELNGSLTTTVTVLHITRVIPQIFFLYGANSQGNGHFLLTKMLSDNPARPTKQYWTVLRTICYTCFIWSRVQ